MSDDAGTKSALPPDAFGGIVHALLRDLAAVGVSVWLHEGTPGSFRCAVAVGTEPTDLFQSPAVRQALPPLLNETTRSGQTRILGLPGVFSDAPQEPATLWMAPLIHEKLSFGAVAILRRGSPATPDLARLQPILNAHLRQLAGGMASMQGQESALVRPPGLPPPRILPPSVEPIAAAIPPSPPSEKRDETKALLGFVQSLQRSLDLQEVAGIAVNDGRLLFGVDRVSLVMKRRGRRGRVIAVSGQESVHPRGNLIRAMGELAARVIESGEPVRFDGTHGATSDAAQSSTHGLPAMLAEPLSAFLQEGGARFLLVVPLFAPERLIPVDDGASTVRAAEPRNRCAFAALVIEQFQSSEPAQQLTSSLDAVVDHVASAVFNAKTHSSLFLLPVWRLLGRGVEWLRGRRLALAVTGLVLLLAFIAALIFVPWEYRVEATGRLMPIVQRDVFAPWDGQVVEMLVAGGEKVQVGQVLLKLQNDELAAELVTAENQLQEKRKLHAAQIAQRDAAERKGNRDEALQLQGKAAETQVEIAGYARQVEILQDRRTRLTIKAPITGVVATFQVKQLLRDRPVKRGDVLLQVMDDTGAWHLELEVAERRVGRILSAQPVASAKSSSPAPARSLSAIPVPDLDVEFRLLTQPGESYHGRLTELATRAVTSEPPGSVVEARADLDQQNLPPRTIGAEVRARISCGPSSLGDVLFGDVVEFVRRYLWW